MPQELESRTLGRIEYIEPNNLFVTSPGNKVQNGIPQPYEDYSFSVNLRVILGDRYSCGMMDDGSDITDNVLEFSSERGTISFMDGTSVNGNQGYLTTNFTDINMNDPSTNTKECLGIESISIRYDSWYYPTVDIRFIDVRGASLMQPAEYEYYNHAAPDIANLGKNPASSNSNFFKAFFSFPYPLFKLSVKGFYGKEVTYDLSVLKCNVVFNSSTGNFEVAASFIGYMYGMYGDLPFPFVYLAPYIDLYGKNTWDEKRATGDFCYLNTTKGQVDPAGIGRPMYTFPELRRVINNVGEQCDTEEAGSDEGKRRAELEKLLAILDGKVIPRYPSKTKNFTWWSWAKGDAKNGFLFVPTVDNPETERKMFEDFYKFSDSLREYNLAVGETSKVGDFINTKPVFEDFYNSVNEAKKERKQAAANANLSIAVIANASAYTYSLEFTDAEVNKLLAPYVAKLVFHKDGDKDNQVLIFDESTSSENSMAEYGDLIDEIKDRFEKNTPNSPISARLAQKDWTIRALKIDQIDYRNYIVDRTNELKSELNEITTKLDEQRKLKLQKALEFDPTVKNLYNMVFAHIDTFMSVFYNTLDNIRQKIQGKDESRKAEKICGGGIETDVNENSLSSTASNGGKLPPFPLFYKEQEVKDSKDKKLMAIWPGAIEAAKDLDEVHLVEAIINATAMNRKIMDVVSEKYNIIRKEGSLVPTNYYDIIVGGVNPYLDVLNDKSMSDSNTLKWIMEVFMLRCYFSMLSGSHISPEQGAENDESSSSVSSFTKKAKLIAELEVGNVVRAFELVGMEPKGNFITQLYTLSENGSSFIDNYLKPEQQWFTSDGVGGNLAYSYLKVKGTNYTVLPVGKFEHAVLEKIKNGETNLGKNSDKFLKIAKDGTKVNSYSCHIYSGGKRVENILESHTSGDFVSASRLFPNYKKLPKTLSSLLFASGTFSKTGALGVDKLYDKIGSASLFGNIPVLPSYRKTEAGTTSIFMDPLYYAQKDGTCGSKAVEARAYLFLMGVPFGNDKKFFLPEKIENGDYPTLLLLREGAVYWRNDFIINMSDDGAPIADTLCDPITYKYTVNGTEIDTLNDIEANDPCFGRRYALEYYNISPKNASQARKRMLIDYFLKWANGVATPNPNAVVADAPVSISLPKPSLDFQTIERFMGLWEIDGTFKKLLTPGSCSSAFTAVYANSFGNSEQLKAVYNVGPDGKLGSTNGKLRSNVLLRDPSEDKTMSEAGKSFIDMFKRFYIGFDTIVDYSCLDNPAETTTVPRNAMNDALSEFIKKMKEQYNVSTEKLKDAEKTDSTGKPNKEFVNPEVFNDDDLKLSCYLALKNMYDKWICSRRRECWKFSCIPERMNRHNNNGVTSDFLRFFYIDEFYHNVGMQIRPNVTQLIEMICKMGSFTEKTNDENLAATSIMKILDLVASKAGCSLLTLPTSLGMAKTYDGDERNRITDVFKAFTYNEAVRIGGIETSFVVLSTSKKSSKLNNQDSNGKNGYKTDGFDIADTWGEIVPLSMFCDGDEDSYVVPSFGVTFAKQNQSFFKDIQLSMEDHQITEYSTLNELMISYQNNKVPKSTSIIGQDLYSVYSNYSYSCNVSMMGDAQITPLMYFQLNNIPMWKGAYMIINVQHNITTRGMETVFKGVRQGRVSDPNKGDNLIFEAEESAAQTPYAPDNVNPLASLNEALDMSDRPLDRINVENVKSIVITLDRTTLQESKKWVNGMLSVVVYYNDGNVENYQDTALTIEARNGLAGRIEDFTRPEDNSVVFSIPAGKFDQVTLVNASTSEEYRDPNDDFYKFTDKRHLVISDTRLGSKKCEIITGETDYKLFESGGFSKVSLGGTAPIMIYGNDPTDINKQCNKDEIKALYKEIFNLVRRMNDAKKPVTFLVNESAELDESLIDDMF